jgi:hypothetical protein
VADAPLLLPRMETAIALADLAAIVNLACRWFTVAKGHLYG